MTCKNCTKIVNVQKLLTPGLFPYHPIIYSPFIDIPECCCQQKLTKKCKVCEKNKKNSKDCSDECLLCNIL